MQKVTIPRNEILFRQGDVGDQLFAVVSGRLVAVYEDQEGNQRPIGEITAGEVVGKMSILTDEPHSATICAIRNSVLAGFSKSAIIEIITKYPQVMLNTTRTIISCLRMVLTSPPEFHTTQNIAIVPISTAVPLSVFAQRLSIALAKIAPTFYLSSKRLDSIIGISGISQTPEQDPYNLRLDFGFEYQFSKDRLIIYETDNWVSPWTKRCIRQADRILLVARVHADPKLSAIESALLAENHGITSPQQILLLLHQPGESLPTGSHHWLDNRSVSRHHHLRGDVNKDLQCLARCLSGRNRSLVLSWCGARAFAHIGVIRALKDAGFDIDMIGGTSNGSIIAAFYAMGYEPDQITQMFITNYLQSKPLRDYTLPIFPIVRGKKFDLASQRAFGEVQIEDLWLNFFCVSSNLSTAEVKVHRRGSLRKAVRVSNSFPGIVPPVIDDNQLLVDGGILNNLPCDIMKELFGGIVIASDVSAKKDFTIAAHHVPSPYKMLWSRLSPFSKSIEFPALFAILVRCSILSNLHKSEEVQRNVDLYLRPSVHKFGLLEFSAIDEIITIGYQYTKEHIEKWQQ